MSLLQRKLKQTIKEANSKEVLSSTNNDLISKVKLLEEINEDVRLAKEEFASYQYSKEKAEEVIELSKRFLAELEKEGDKIGEERDNLILQHQKFTIFVDKTRADMELERNELLAEEEVIGKRIRDARHILGGLEEQINIFKDKGEEILGIYKSAEKKSIEEFELVKDSINQGIGTLEQINKAEVFITDKVEEQSINLQDKIDSASSLVVNLQEREKKVEQRERDINIVSARLSALFKQMYPDRELKI